MKSAKNLAKQQDSNEAHFDICRGSLAHLCGTLSFIKKEKKTTKTRMRKITSDKRNYAARLPVRCSAVFILKQCGRPYDVVHPVSDFFCYGSKKSNAVHFLIVLWFIYTRCEVHPTFSSFEKMMFE